MNWQSSVENNDEKSPPTIIRGKEIFVDIKIINSIKKISKSIFPLFFTLNLKNIEKVIFSSKNGVNARI